MQHRVLWIGVPILLLALGCSAVVFAQAKPSAEPAQQAPAAAPVAQEAAAPTAVAASAGDGQIAVPAGTHLPLTLRNGVNTRTAKAGDVVYFQTLYPIALNNRVVIPMGSFVRGEILTVKRPGRISGRGEFRIALAQMTFLN